MNSIYKIIIGMIVFWMMVGCENNNLSIKDNLVVLEGYLYEGQAVDSIHLAETVSFESGDTIYPPITDAQVTIAWKNSDYQLQNIGNGYYSYLNNNLQVIEGDSYSIAINYEGQTITSSAVVPKKPKDLAISDTIMYVETPSFGSGPILIGGPNDTTGIKVTWEDPDNSYYFAVIESIDLNAANIHDDGNGTIHLRTFKFRSEPFKASEYRINQMLLQKYGRHRVKIYHVTQEYADLYENRSQDSRNLSEPLTNVLNGLGIFTAFSYAETYFRVEKEQ